MATTIKLVNQFADSSTRTLEIGPINLDGNAIGDVKTNVKALNSDPSAIAPYYLSDSGASFTKVANAYIITENITPINLEG